MCLFASPYFISAYKYKSNSLSSYFKQLSPIVFVFQIFKKTSSIQMADNNVNNNNTHVDDASSSHRPLHSERSKPSTTSPSVLSLGEVLERIHELQLELATRTSELGDVSAKYDEALVKTAHTARETAQL